MDGAGAGAESNKSKSNKFTLLVEGTAGADTVIASGANLDTGETGDPTADDEELADAFMNKELAPDLFLYKAFRSCLLDL